MKKFLGLDHPAFRPLWLRLAVTGASAGWGLVELIWGSSGWAMIFLGLAAYCGWVFFIDFSPDDDPDRPDL
ncbi:MAG: hypothetical protein U1E34_00610 [Amaricoccus sp.]